ncbi:hypothetical protein KIPB_004759, partial [Kipferlia bialata]
APTPEQICDTCQFEAEMVQIIIEAEPDMSADDVRALLEDECYKTMDNDLGIQYCINLYDQMVDLVEQGYTTDIVCELMGKCA